MDVMSLYINIPQEEGINIVCNAYEPIPQKRTSYPYTTSTTANYEERSNLSLRRTPSNLMEKTTYKYMGLPWAPKRQLLSPIFSWLR